MKDYPKKLQPNETGFASLIVGIILVLVLSLLTVGFAQLVRSEQRQTLDKQLSTQAFYAAESGVNSVAKLINQPGGINTSDTSDCNAIINSFNLRQIGPASLNVSNSCLLVNLHPPDMKYTDVEDQSTVAQFTSSDPATGGSPAPISNITISWECRTNPCTFSNVAPNLKAAFPALSNWTANTGVMEVSVTPLAAGALDRTSLINQSFTTLLYPRSGTANDVQVSSATPTGVITPVLCNKTHALTPANQTALYACTATIQASGASSYLVRLRSIYQASTADITISGAGNNVLDFSNGQAVIDSTGKAQDVLKRIQVSIPLSASGQWLNALEGGSICKTLDVSPDPNVTGPDSTVANDSNDNGSCALTTSAASPNPANADPGTQNCTTPPCSGVITGNSYNWSRTLFNDSNNSSPVKSCTWTFTSDGGISASPSVASGGPLDDMCQPYGTSTLNTGPGTILVTYTPSPTIAPFPLGCYSIPETATLTMTLQNGGIATQPTVPPFKMPQC